MPRPKFFHTLSGGNIPLPLFFPDATRAVIKSLDSSDTELTKTPGVLVNTLHLSQTPGIDTIKKHGGIKKFMAWPGATISDSGGFQVMSLAGLNPDKNFLTDSGVRFKFNGKKEIFTPQKSIEIQLKLKTDLVVVLDQFTPVKADYETAKITVNRTILWAKQSKIIFDKLTKNMPTKPYLIGVVQGGDFLDLRTYCTQELVKIGFDGLGYGGWPLNESGFNYDVARVIASNCPSHYLLYGLGIGKPDEILGCYRLGWQIFDCVLPSRDARHRRLYVFKAKTMDAIDLNKQKFYSYYAPDKKIYSNSLKPVSTACDCLLCQRYSRSYLCHLFKIGDMAAGRLATIHNLRFYSLLMEKIRDQIK